MLPSLRKRDPALTLMKNVRTKAIPGIDELIFFTELMSSM
jgi:hypothetical protein